MTKIAIGSDHAGFELKEVLISYLKSKNTEVIDKGCYSLDRADYPDAAHAVATAVTNNEVTFGILMCGSGNGINMSANKHKGINNVVNKIKNTFNNVSYEKIKEIDWSGNEGLDIDFRTTLYFYSTDSKNEIYNKMNVIKPNPIKFN